MTTLKKAGRTFKVDGVGMVHAEWVKGDWKRLQRGHWVTSGLPLTAADLGVA